MCCAENCSICSMQCRPFTSCNKSPYSPSRKHCLPLCFHCKVSRLNQFISEEFVALISESISSSCLPQSGNLTTNRFILSDMSCVPQKCNFSDFCRCHYRPRSWEIIRLVASVCLRAHDTWNSVQDQCEFVKPLALIQVTSLTGDSLVIIVII